MCIQLYICYGINETADIFISQNKVHITRRWYTSLRSCDAYGAPQLGVEAVEKRPKPLSLQGLSGKIAISSPESCFRPRHASLQAVRHQSEFATAD